MSDTHARLLMIRLQKLPAHLVRPLFEVVGYKNLTKINGNWLRDAITFVVIQDMLNVLLDHIGKLERDIKAGTLNDVPEWVSLSDIIDTINSPNWNWHSHPNAGDVKYIHVRIDTRDGHALIYPSRIPGCIGTPMTLEDLAKQL